MAGLRFKIDLKNMDAVKVNLNQLTNRVQRMQHLIKELHEGLVDLENDMNNLSVDFIPEPKTEPQEG